MAPKTRWLTSTLLILSGLVYVGLGYFTNRANFPQLLGLFILAFGIYFYAIRQNLNLKTGLLAALAFRLMLLFSWPALSDDYFRFIWDGSLVAAGLNPYLKLPSQFLPDINQIDGLTAGLYQNLNSPDYFSVYPPVCQFIFAVSTIISQEDNFTAVLVMRGILMLADLGNIFLIVTLLQRFQKPARLVLLYALNPLVIVELTGNLHFESLMILLTLAGLYYLIRQKIISAGVLFALAIGVKFLPLIFMPFILFKVGWRTFIPFAASIGITLLILFIPFVSTEFFLNLGQSLNLYFQKFEFNASIYYLLRGLGFAYYGYNNIADFGPLLSVSTFAIIMVLAYKTRKLSDNRLPELFLAALSIHFFLATTVHPWYLTTLVAFTVFTPYRYTLMWSGAAVLSYATYQTKAYQENLLLTALEYTVVWLWLMVEIIQWRRSTKSEMNVTLNQV